MKRLAVNHPNPVMDEWNSVWEWGRGQDVNKLYMKHAKNKFTTPSMGSKVTCVSKKLDELSIDSKTGLQT